VFRFFFGSLYRNGHFFRRPPTPANYRLMEDGRVAFIDFGMDQAREPRGPRRGDRGAARPLMDGDVAAVHRQLGAMGLLRPGRRRDQPGGGLRALSTTWTRWYVEDRELTVDPRAL